MMLLNLKTIIKLAKLIPSLTETTRKFYYFHFSTQNKLPQSMLQGTVLI